MAAPEAARARATVRAIARIHGGHAVMAARKVLRVVAERAEHALFAAVALDALRVLRGGGHLPQEIAEARFEFGRRHSIFRSTRVRRKLVLFERAVTRVERDTGGTTMRHGSAIGAALLGWILVATTHDAHAANANAEHTDRAHAKRVAAKASADAAHQARRRSGSAPAADKPAAGEVVGGLSRKEGKRGAKGGKKGSGGHHRVARVIP